jgi:hypothetical protein
MAKAIRKGSGTRKQAAFRGCGQFKEHRIAPESKPWDRTEPA